jgi:hypothetical protein
MQQQFSLFGTPDGEPVSGRRNDVRTGDAAEAFVIAKLLKWGFDAHDARRDLPYDVVVDVGDGRICRVQVKGRGRARDCIWHFRALRGNWRSATGTYAYTEADYDVSAFVALRIDAEINTAVRWDELGKMAPVWGNQMHHLFPRLA